MNMNKKDLITFLDDVFTTVTVVVDVFGGLNDVLVYQINKREFIADIKTVDEDTIDCLVYGKEVFIGDIENYMDCPELLSNSTDNLAEEEYEALAELYKKEKELVDWYLEYS